MALHEDSGKMGMTVIFAQALVQKQCSQLKKENEFRLDVSHIFEVLQIFFYSHVIVPHLIIGKR